MKFKNTNRLSQNKVWVKSIKQWIKARDGKGNQINKPLIIDFIQFDNKHLK
jgi:hypothetical protein